MGTLSNAEQITCDVFNIGFNAIPAGTMIPLNWQVDGGAQSGSDMLTLAAPLMPLTSIQHTFSTTVDMSTPATYSLDVAVALGGDGDPGNDLKNKMVTSLPPAPGGGTLPFHEDFETFGATINGNVVPLGWINDANDGTADWLFENSAPSGSTTNGPVADHTTGVAGAGIFAYTEDSLSVNDTINLLTPCLSLAGTTNPLASFWISSATLTNPAQQNPVAIDVEASGGGLTMDVVPATAQLGTGNQWVQYQVELTAFIGQTVRLQFRGRDNNQGVSTTINDVGLDDIAVVDFVEGTGQRPQFGLAALDINSSLEANGFPIDLGLGGPYLVSVNTGSSADFTMTGVPNQPFLLIAGTLSVNAANFGLVGQLDLNNPGLELIGDGTGGGFLNSFFIFDGTGERKLSFGISPLFAGLMKSFQCINLTGTPLVIAFSNAVQASFL